MSSPHVAIVVGTRPEVIKMAPLILACHDSDASLGCSVVATAQHRHLLDEALHVFGIQPDHDLNIMRSSQTLSGVTRAVLEGMQEFLLTQQPDVILVQGDTTTVLATSLAAYYQKIPVGHVEAGIRTGNAYAPFPEEMNRRLTDQLSSLHFAPTARARENLLSEGIPPESIVVTGNTAIDAIQWVIRRYGLAIGAPSDAEETTILVTAHRRESFGPPLRDICQAIRLVAQLNVTVVFPVHPNPQVRHTVLDELAGHDNIHLTDPLDYLSFVRLMLRSRLILTDSGGIQEEATALGRPVLVLRNETDRPEAVEAGQAKLVGTDPERILAVTQILLQDQVEYERMSHRSEVYGDGRAAKRIWRTVDGYIAHAE